MSLLGRIRHNLRQVKELTREVRHHYLAASARTVAQGSAGLAGLSGFSHLLGPRLRHLVDHRIEGLQRVLDDLNCALAEKALPPSRVDKVHRLCHAESEQCRQNLTVVGQAQETPREPVSRSASTRTKAGAQSGKSSRSSSGASRKVGTGRKPGAGQSLH